MLNHHASRRRASVAIYASEVALLLICCQECGREQRVEVSRALIDQSGDWARVSDLEIALPDAADAEVARLRSVHPENVG